MDLVSSFSTCKWLRKRCLNVCMLRPCTPCGDGSFQQDATSTPIVYRECNYIPEHFWTMLCFLLHPSLSVFRDVLHPTRRPHAVNPTYIPVSASCVGQIDSVAAYGHRRYIQRVRTLVLPLR